MAPPKPAEPEAAYVNEADPLELDDDELIEVDDEFDDDLGGGDGLDDLDMMLSEQENAEQTEEQLNQAIDEMLEQPTVFPDAEEQGKAKSDADKKPDEEEDDTRSIEEKYPGFDNDEFMLDNPTKN